MQKCRFSRRQMRASLILLLEKQKLRFCIRYLWKTKRNQLTKIGDYVFLWNRRPHAKIELTWTSKKIGLKKSLRLDMQASLQLHTDPAVICSLSVCFQRQGGGRGHDFIDAGRHKKGKRKRSGESNHRLLCYEGTLATSRLKRLFLPPSCGR